MSVRRSGVVVERRASFPLSDRVERGPGRVLRSAVQVAAQSRPPEPRRGWVGMKIEQDGENNFAVLADMQRMSSDLLKSIPM